MIRWCKTHERQADNPRLIPGWHDDNPLCDVVERLLVPVDAVVLVREPCDEPPWHEPVDVHYPSCKCGGSGTTWPDELIEAAATEWRRVIYDGAEDLEPDSETVRQSYKAEVRMVLDALVVQEGTDT